MGDNRMKNKIFSIIIGAVVFSGCVLSQPAKVNFNHQNEKNIKYNNLYAECVDKNDSIKLQQIINKKLKEKNIYGDDLKLICEIMNFDKGNRALRYFVGFGAGKAKLETKNELFDINGTKISEFTLYSSVSIGALGGNAEELFDAIANNTIKHISTDVLKIKK
ncbi:DUF4410 domain-containing protein [Campylobacter ureolyticus]